MPATAIIGYPPGKMGPKEVFEQVGSLYKLGWRRFKAPVGSTQQLTIDRLKSARLAAPDAWIGCDAAWIYQDVESAVELLEKLDEVNLGWFEDIFPPGNAEIVAQLRKRTSVPIAMGDEQGGIYYPEALINKNAVDVIRIDLTCMGGITGGRKIVDQCLNAGVTFASHMFAHVHSQVFGAWGFSDVPIEWGVPWTGVDPYADSLSQPIIETGGNMKALEEGAGFGNLVNFEWIQTQAHLDPDQIFQKR
jgi:L-alanine-DL-glutamate epimerase-like enolase superfamily enzyme